MTESRRNRVGTYIDQNRKRLERNLWLHSGIIDQEQEAPGSHVSKEFEDEAPR